MIPTTVDDLPVYLLTAPPNWREQVSAKFAVKLIRDAGLSNREARRALASETLCTLTYTPVIEGSEARDLRAALRAYDNRPVLVPFWPAEQLLSDLDDSIWAGGLRVFYEPDWSAWQILADATAPDSFTPSADCLTAPALWGKFTDLPNPDALTDDALRGKFSLIETGLAGYAIRPASTETTSGPVIAGSARPLLPVQPNWAHAVTAGGIDLRVEQEQTGYGRAPSENYVAQSARRRHKVTVTAEGAEIGAMLALFRAVRGHVGAWWVPGVYTESVLAAPAAVDATEIQLTDAAALVGEWGLALDRGDGVIQARHIASRVGALLTIDPALTVALPVCSPVQELLLCRLVADNLTFRFIMPECAEIDIEVIELPTETVVPPGETTGETIGDLGGKWWGYVVTDGVTTWRFTSYDIEVDAGETLGVFEPRPIDHGDITMEINLARHDVDLTVGWWSGNPFWRAKLDALTYAPGKANLPAPPLTVQIYEGTIADPSAAELIFTGRAKKPKFNGAKCTCAVAGLTALLDVKGPIQTVGPRCWVPLYSQLCGLDRDDLGMDVDYHGKDENGALLFGVPGNTAFPATPADHFRFGYAERTLSDGTKRRFTIVRSDAPADVERGALIGFPGNVDATRKYLKRTTSGTTHTGIWSLAACPYDHGHGGVVNLASSGHNDTYGDWTAVGTMTITPDDDFLHAHITISGLSATLNGNATSVWAVIWGNQLGNGTHGPFDWDSFELVDIGLKLVSNQWDQGFYALVLPDYPWGALFPLLSERDVFDKVETYNEDNEVGTVDNSVHAQQAFGDWPLASGGDESTPAVVPSGAAADDVVITQETRTWAGKNQCIQTGSGPTRYTKIDGEIVEELSEENTTLRIKYSTLAIAVLGTPPDSPESGWRLLPGCDKSYERCKALGNGDNFRGFPHFPKTNPALMPITQDTPSTGKK